MHTHIYVERWSWNVEDECFRDAGFQEICLLSNIRMYLSCSRTLNDLDMLQTFVKGGRILILKFKKGKIISVLKRFKL